MKKTWPLWLVGLLAVITLLFFGRRISGILSTLNTLTTSTAHYAQLLVDLQTQMASQQTAFTKELEAVNAKLTASNAQLKALEDKDKELLQTIKDEEIIVTPILPAHPEIAQYIQHLQDLITLKDERIVHLETKILVLETEKIPLLELRIGQLEKGILDRDQIIRDVVKDLRVWKKVAYAGVIYAGCKLLEGVLHK